MSVATARSRWPELRDALVAGGFDSARTYIQSGNVIVEGGPVDDGATEGSSRN